MPKINYKVLHAKDFTEEFEFRERTSAPTVPWEGLSFLTMDFPIFYGTSDLLIRQIGLSDQRTLFVTRDRNVRVMTDFTADGNPNQAQTRHLEVCSVVTFIEDQVVPFTADAFYSSSNVSGPELETILTELGRAFTPYDPLNPKDYIEGPFEGTFTGKWAIHTSWYSGIPTPSIYPGQLICSVYITPTGP